MVFRAVSSLLPSWGLLLFCFHGTRKSALTLLRHYYTGCQEDIQSTAPDQQTEVFFWDGLSMHSLPSHNCLWLALPRCLITLSCGEKGYVAAQLLSINGRDESSPVKLLLIKVTPPRMQLNHLPCSSVWVLTLSL